jgi:hypothetical protein
MTDQEFQTATDLARVRLIKAELDVLEASTNVTPDGPITELAMMNTRSLAREWERLLLDSFKVRKGRAKGASDES